MYYSCFRGDGRTVAVARVRGPKLYQQISANAMYYTSIPENPEVRYFEHFRRKDIKAPCGSAPCSLATEYDCNVLYIRVSFYNKHTKIHASKKYSGTTLINCY